MRANDRKPEIGDCRNVDRESVVTLTVDTPVDGIAPRLDGYVTAVSDKNLIEISIGSDDGLRAHHFMEVYRKNTYVGRVEIVMVEPDRAVAKIIPEFRRGIIKKGDRVATKLS